jgi:hypothetical protein
MSSSVKTASCPSIKGIPRFKARFFPGVGSWTTARGNLAENFLSTVSLVSVLPLSMTTTFQLTHGISRSQKQANVDASSSQLLRVAKRMVRDMRLSAEKHRAFLQGSASI